MSPGKALTGCLVRRTLRRCDTGFQKSLAQGPPRQRYTKLLSSSEGVPPGGKIQNFTNREVAPQPRDQLVSSWAQRKARHQDEFSTCTSIVTSLRLQTAQYPSLQSGDGALRFGVITNVRCWAPFWAEVPPQYFTDVSAGNTTGITLFCIMRLRQDKVGLLFFLYTWIRASWIEFNNCPTRCNLFSLLCFCMQLYMFRVFTPIIRSSYNCNYSFWYWLTGSATIRSRCYIYIYIYTWVRVTWIEFNNYPTRCDIFSLLCFCRQLYMFRVLTPIIRSSYNYNYSFWYWLTAMNKICC